MVFDPELHARRQEAFLLALLEHQESKELPEASDHYYFSP
jgi:hypothetical protein